MRRKLAPGNVHKKEDTDSIHELKIRQAGTTHEMLVKHLASLITCVELECDAPLFLLGCGCVHTHMRDEVPLCLPNCAGALATLLLCRSPGKASEERGPRGVKVSGLTRKC